MRHNEQGARRGERQTPRDVSPGSPTRDEVRPAERTAPTVTGRLMAAGPDVTFDRVLVRECPWCSWDHVFHVPAGVPVRVIRRSPRCAPGRYLTVRVLAAVPRQGRRAS